VGICDCNPVRHAHVIVARTAPKRVG
jgi:hypothetical protein